METMLHIVLIKKVGRTFSTTFSTIMVSSNWTEKERRYVYITESRSRLAEEREMEFSCSNLNNVYIL
jgi:hypothetical protein